VLAFADMLHLLPYEFACLGRRRFAFARILSSPFDCFLFWHNELVSLQKVRLVVRWPFLKGPCHKNENAREFTTQFLITWQNAGLYLGSMLG